VNGVGRAFIDAVRQLDTMRPPEGSGPAHLIQGEQIIHFPDFQAESYLQNAPPQLHRVIEIGDVRTTLMVPLRKDDAVIGIITAFRQEVRSFTEKQITLLQNFAAQAVIAMENARLLGELRQRTGDLEESLEYQTATSDVLKVISKPDANLNTVIDTVLNAAARLCEGGTVTIFLRRDEQLELMASNGISAAIKVELAARPIVVDRRTVSGRAVLTGDIIHVEDVLVDPDYDYPPTATSGIRTMLAVPFLRDRHPIGSILLARRAVKPFAAKEIELVRTFADQAVIAIANARLLSELRQRTEEVAELNRGLEARVAEQVDELGRVGRLKRFLAPQLAELIVSRGDEKILESHRREIVVVFCDLRGYTAFTETAEPEEVLEFLRQYHGALGPLVSEFEGTLDQFSGDGIMVFFNDPVPIPDPAERAVKMAMAMREAAGDLIAAWRRRGRELGFGAGIAQGYATLGQIGFAERSGYTAIGTVCNVAARLCAEAKDGQILIGQRVAVAVERTATLEEIGALTLKGLMQPVVAFNVR
jgi:adenylate cyclase